MSSEQENREADQGGHVLGWLQFGIGWTRAVAPARGHWHNESEGVSQRDEGGKEVSGRETVSAKVLG